MKYSILLKASIIVSLAHIVIARKCQRWYSDSNAPRCIGPDKISDVEDQQQCHATKHCCVGRNGKCYAVAKKGSTKAKPGPSKSNEDMAKEAMEIKRRLSSLIISRSLNVGLFGPLLLPYGGEEPYPGFSMPPPFVCQKRPSFPAECDVTKTKTVMYIRDPPVNIPYCQRIACDPKRPELDSKLNDCRDTPGCFFDRGLRDYRKRFGHSVMPGVPVCHLAIRNSVFLDEARKVVKKTGSWSAFFNQCLLEKFNEVIRTPKEGCQHLSMLSYFKHKPKIAGWKGITDYECVLIDGCWIENKGCFYPVDMNKITVQSSPTTQEIKMTSALYYGRPRCLEFDDKTPKAAIESYHNCLISGCKLDRQAQDSYYNYLYDFGKNMDASDHWVFWKMVESGKYGAHNLHEYDPLPKQDVTVTPFSLIISYADNSSESSLLNEIKTQGSASILDSLKSVTGLNLPPEHDNEQDSFFKHMQSLQTPCSESFTSFGGRPCGPPPYTPKAAPEHCPYQPITARDLKPLEGSFEGCCDVTMCYHSKDKLIEARSGAAAYYSIWSYWTECSTTCGPGTKSRRRSCVGIDQSGCKGKTVEKVPCEVSPCSSWTNWGLWSSCPVTCDRGVQSRQRSCIPTGSFCPGNREEVRECATSICRKRDDGYETWSSWSGSCIPCGSTVSRSRKCIAGECSDDKLYESKTCERQCGSWSEWRPWSHCVPAFGTNECQMLWARSCTDRNGLPAECQEGSAFDYRECLCP